MTAPTKKKTKFNPLQVSEVRRLTDNAVEVSFEVPEDLREDYDYVPGQYVALRADINGQEVRRSYSICDIPRPGVIRVAIKRDLGGVFSSWANDELTPGTVIEVMNPQGAFTSRVHVTSLNDAQELLKEELADVDGAPHLVAIAAGSGITPIMSIAQALLSGSKAATFELIYANKGGGDVMFAEEIGDLKDKYPTRFAVHHVLSREQRVNPLFSGRIDDEKLSLLLDKVVRTDDTDEWFLCGPFELVQLVRGRRLTTAAFRARATPAARSSPTRTARTSPSPSSWTACPVRSSPRPPRTRRSSTRRCVPARTSPSPAPAACAAPAARRSSRASSRWTRTTRWRPMRSPTVTS